MQQSQANACVSMGEMSRDMRISCLTFPSLQDGTMNLILNNRGDFMRVNIFVNLETKPTENAFVMENISLAPGHNVFKEILGFDRYDIKIQILHREKRRQRILDTLYLKTAERMICSVCESQYAFLALTTSKNVPYCARCAWITHYVSGVEFSVMPYIKRIYHDGLYSIHHDAHFNMLIVSSSLPAHVEEEHDNPECYKENVKHHFYKNKSKGPTEAILCSGTRCCFYFFNIDRKVRLQDTTTTRSTEDLRSFCRDTVFKPVVRDVRGRTGDAIESAKHIGFEEDKKYYKVEIEFGSGAYKISLLLCRCHKSGILVRFPVAKEGGKKYVTGSSLFVVTRQSSNRFNCDTSLWFPCGEGLLAINTIAEKGGYKVEQRGKDYTVLGVSTDAIISNKIQYIGNKEDFPEDISDEFPVKAYISYDGKRFMEQDILQSCETKAGVYTFYNKIQDERHYQVVKFVMRNGEVFFLVIKPSKKENWFKSETFPLTKEQRVEDMQRLQTIPEYETILGKRKNEDNT